MVDKLLRTAGRTIIHSILQLGKVALLLLSLLFCASASAQVTFTNVAVSPTSGTVNGAGTLSVTFTGTVKASVANDAVSFLYLYDNGTMIHNQSFPVTYNSQGQLVNTLRTINVTVALTAGSHSLRFLAQTDEGGEGYSQYFTVTASAPVQTNGASYVSQSVPTSMVPGQTYSVSVTMKNTGTKTWIPTGTQSHGLGSQNPANNWNWGLVRAYTPSSVAPGANATFNFTVTAPPTAGTYNFQWQMVQEQLEWFGPTTPNLSVTVDWPPPTATFSSPAQGAVFQSSGGTATVAFSGTASAGAGSTISSVKLLEGGVAFASGSSTSISGSKALAVGAHTIELRVTNNHNKTTSVFRDITVRPPAPTASFTAPANGAVISTGTATASVPVTATAVPASGASISQIRLYVDGVQKATSASASLSSTQTLAAGVRTLGVEATDNYGSVSTRSNITVTVQAPMPTVTIATPTNYSYYSAVGSTASIPVQGSATAVGGLAITKLELLDNGTVIDTLTGVASYNVTRAFAPGAHSLQLRATNSANVQGSSGLINFVVYSQVAGNSAVTAGPVNVPTTMRAGQPYTVSMKMLNNGTTTWSAASGYRLGSQNPQDNRTWAVRAYLDSSVAPGQTATFTFQVAAPAVPGTYNFQYRMVQEGVAWFGDLSTNVAVAVSTGDGPTVSLAASPANARVSGSQSQAVTLSGAGSRSGGTVTKLELFRDAGQGYGMTPVHTTTGAAATLNYSSSQSLTAGVYQFKLRATDGAGVQTDSKPVFVHITNSSLLGQVSGIRSSATGAPQLFGWVCQPANAAALTYKVLLDAPSLDYGAVELTAGTANVSTEPDNAVVSAQCGSGGHHFVVDLSSYTATYAGRALYVYAEAPSARVTLPCADNNCTMPGSQRVALSSPAAGAIFGLPQPAFLKLKLTNVTGNVDEVGFMVNGEWVPAAADGAVGEYSAQKFGLAASATPYMVYARLRQGNTTVRSIEVPFYMSAATVAAITAPSANATLSTGSSQALSASVSGNSASTVRFYANGTLVGTGSNNGGTWTAYWTPTVAGAFSLEARAFDSSGVQIAVSAAVAVTVAPGSGSSDTPLAINVSVPQLNNGIGGALPGGVVVNPDASAGYSLPLQMPPGILGMVPKLSLNYDGNSPTGLAGLGWSVAGISRIERCGKVKATDGRGDGVRFVEAASGQAVDRLCLDGQRLLLVGGSTSNAAYWASGAVYRTEVETFVQVTALGADGKQGFEVKTKDGRISYYGQTADARIEGTGRSDGLPHRWYINRSSDRSNNYISYTYNEDSVTGQSTPATISWGGNSLHGTPHFAKVVFTYETRPDIRLAYLAGSRLDERVRLSKIETLTDTSPNNLGTWSTALTYTLSYGQSPSSGRSLLQSVRACDAGNDGCLPATTFSWGERNPAAPRSFVALGGQRTGPDLATLGAESANKRFDTIIAADVNGDGRTDLLERYRSGSSNQQRQFQSTANGNWTTMPLFSSGADVKAVLEAGDFDGDGLTDLLVTNSANAPLMCRGSLRSGDQYTCATALPFSDVQQGGGLGQAMEVGVKLRLVRDFNADGRDDLYFRTQPPSSGLTPRAWECLSSGAGFTCTEVTGTSNQKSLGFEGGDVEPMGPSAFADIDADGRVDRLLVPKCEYKVLGGSTSAQWYCGNDDLGTESFGITATSEPEAGAVRVSGNWLTYPDHQTAIVPSLPMGTLVGDLNADGYSDFVLGTVTLNTASAIVSGQSWLCLSKGDGHGDCRVLPSTNLVGNTARGYLGLTVGDFDGDGVVDVLRPISDTWDTSNLASDKYQLCHLGSDSASSAADLPLFQRCEAWTGPQFFTPSQRLIYSGAAGTGTERSAFLGDFDGDGKTDIATYLGGSAWVIHGAASQAKVGEALDKLVSVTNGLGATETITYGLPNDTSVYTPTVARADNQNTIGKLGYPNRPLVKVVSRSAGIAGNRETTYSYGRLAMEPSGRGSLGFAQTVRHDVSRSVTSTTEPCLEFPYIGNTCNSAERINGGVVLSSETNVWNKKIIGLAGGGQTYYPYLADATVARKDPGNIDLATTRTQVSAANGAVDDWGNVTDITTTSTGAGMSWTMRKEMVYQNDPTTWRLGELISVTETRSNNYNTIARQTTYAYDSAGRLSTETRLGDRYEKLVTTYDRSTASFGLIGRTILNWTDPASTTSPPAELTRAISQVAYTANGRFVASVTNAASHVETYEYDTRTGVQTRLTDANGLSTNSTADGFGRVLSVRAPDGTIVETSIRNCIAACPLDAASVTVRDVKQAGDVRAAVPVLVFSDNAGQAIRTLTWGFSGDQVVADTTYDILGRTSKQFWPRAGNATTAIADDAATAAMRSYTTYDVLDRPLLVETRDETNVAKTTTHTWTGFTHTISNPLNQVITEKRDVWGKLAETLDAASQKTEFRFDAFGNLARTTDPKLNVVTVTYDNWGRRKQLKDPDLGIINYVVDALGQVGKQISPNEAATGATVMQYDALGRMTSRVSADQTATWTYDRLSSQGSCTNYRSCGKLVESATVAGTSSLDFWQRQTYDDKGRPDTTTTHLDVDYSSKRSYDAWGRLSREQHQRGSSAAKIFDRRYNAWGQLVRVERAGAALWTAMGKDASQRLTGWTLGNGLNGSQQFDTFTGRQAMVAVGSALLESYIYDVLGNVKERSEQWNGTSVKEYFEYDGLNRLWTSQITAPTQLTKQVFTYDEIGNIKTKTGVGSYVYPDSGAGSVRPHAVSSIAGAGFGYDDNGNMTSGAGRTMTWTSFDMPRQITKSTAQGTAQSTFYYGADHQRVKQVRTGGTLPDATVWYAGAMEVEVAAGGAVKVKTYLPEGIGVEVEQGAAADTWYVHHDRLGSVIAMSNAGGTITRSLAYDSWGKRRDLTTNATPDALTGGDEDNKGFTGHEMLDDLDLVHMNGRVYDPLVARFISADPIIQAPEHSQSYNRYSYVWNNPTNLTDPTGFRTERNESQTAPVVCDAECQQRRKCLWDSNCTITVDNNSSRGRDKTSVSTNSAQFDLKKFMAEMDALEAARLELRRAEWAERADWFGQKQNETGNWWYAIPGTVATILADEKSSNVVAFVLSVGRSGPRGAPRNSHLAGEAHPKTGVVFDKAGYPDFSKVAIAEVKIAQTGSRAGDFRAANAAAGLSKTPEGYTWHHHQDGRTMQLVPRDIHAQTGHTGGYQPKE